MNIKRIILIPCLICVMAFSMAATSAMAQTEMDIDYSWSAPTSGSTVDHYVIEHSIDGGSWTQIATSNSNTFTLAASVGVSHQIRVAGVDASDRQGPFSVASDAYSPDPGLPSQPGKPIVF